MKQNHTLRNALRMTIGCLLVSGSAIAVAGPVTNWEMNNVSFDDGTTVSGTFTYNANTDTLQSYSISVQDGTLSNFVYTSSDSVLNAPITNGTGANGTNFASNEIFLEANDGSRALVLNLASSLIGSNGLDSLLVNESDLSTASWEMDQNYDFRFVTGGSVEQVPEPASIALTGIALAGLAAARRRKQA